MSSELSIVALIVGIVMGAIMLGAVTFVYVRNQSFGLGGSMLTPFGVMLIGLSIWQTVEISVSPDGGIDAKFKSLQEQVKTSSGRLDEVTKVTSKLILDESEILKEIVKTSNVKDNGGKEKTTLPTKEIQVFIKVDDSLPKGFGAVCNGSVLEGLEVYLLSLDRRNLASVVLSRTLPCSVGVGEIGQIEINRTTGGYILGSNLTAAPFQVLLIPPKSSNK